ncbi:potassium transporter Kup [Ottowia sp.]|uniref:potassium transporter Kup n=1 Tax=Ottowia sp. TaxID=1898956 RepID=UPI0026233906|nr:potassium transporter Kup [Ottowia sp.]MCP5256440.1 potassium transporter Kup [Burkholderiaceae bacterium]HRW73887.1 potassium transporter Kup [Ottowia sp.]
MSQHRSGLPALTLGALGVVYGDIGTSPLYAFKEVFASGQVPFNTLNVLSALSMFIWALVFVVTFKYIGLIMRADNGGEGGMMALLALAARAVGDRPGLRATMLAVGAFGVALFFGDGVITPAISVLSAVEGLEVVTPAAKPFVMGIALMVLAALFLVQRRGTGNIGRYFGPIMILWFLALAVTGAVQIAREPDVLRAFSPLYAVEFIGQHPHLAFLTLGAVFLCLTGAEALYADMGHFGKQPIRLAWFALVMPALVVNYLGQGALVLQQPEAIANPLYRLAPGWALVPMVVLATLATVIASQALISGAYSAAKQSIQLGFLPRMRVLYTSEQEAGQIYIGAVNWLLLAGVVVAVVLFRNSAALAAAYGISVSLLMVITTWLTFFVVRHGWGYPQPVALAATGLFLAVDLLFFASNALKIADGGWFPLLMAALVFTVMITWKRGRELLTESTLVHAIDLAAFLQSIFADPPPRVAGTAVFLASVEGVTPSALMHSLKHYKVLHERNLFVTVRSHEIPRVPSAERVQVTPLGNECWQVIVNYGFKDDFDLPAALTLTRQAIGPLDPMSTSYFLSRDIVVPTLGGGMALWREKLFSQMHRNASAAAEFLNLPSNAVVELGSKVEI